MAMFFFNNENGKTRRPPDCGKSRAVESEENQKQVSLASHRPWKSRKTRGIPTFPTAPTAAGISQTRSGNLIVADRKKCLTPDTHWPRELLGSAELTVRTSAASRSEHTVLPLPRSGPPTRTLEQLAGCELVRSNGSHNIFRTKTGRTFPVPRHPGDIGTGLLRKIIKEAGLNMSVLEFMQA